MKLILLILILLTLIHPAYGLDEVRHEIYSKAGSSDEGIYIYFSDIIKNAEKVLTRFLEEDKNTPKLGISLNSRLKLIEGEIRFYEYRGVKTNASWVVEPFVTLSDGIRKLSHFQSVFMDSIEELNLNENDSLAYTNARTAVLNMKLAADELNDSITEIDRMKLKNETSYLHFRTEKLKSLLENVYDLIDHYEDQLSEFETNETGQSFIVTISDKNPILYQEVKIYIYAKNVTPLSLFIDEKEYTLKGNTVKYRFEETGEHRIYASGLADGRTVKSNVLYVHVTKIPTYIILSSESAAYLNEDVEVEGFLLDYYGNPVQGAVDVKIDGNSTRLSVKGFFSFNVTKAREGFLNVSALYSGNETHEGCNASISIFFSRFLVSLVIQPDKKQVNANEAVNFKGYIDVPYNTTIQIFVNSSVVKELNVSQNFNFTLFFKSYGTYNVYAYFQGNELYKPAKSNTAKIVISGTHNYWILAILSGLVVISTLYFSKRKRQVEKVKSDASNIHPRDVELEKVEKKVNIQEVSKSPSDAYNDLFIEIVNKYKNKYKLSKSTTPRELLKLLKKESFAEKLKIVTELHEKNVYGGVKLSDKELEIYIKLIAELLRQMRG
ncbi:MAG: Ig-like domain repeat protein [Archaeoglobus sp.]|nr:Ig-like domain repeat protein [Archaeoglobus sp.]